MVDFNALLNEEDDFAKLNNDKLDRLKLKIVIYKILDL